MQRTIFNCFCTASEKSGNPAAVVTDFTGDDVAKAKLAKQYNLPVKVFIAAS